MLTKNRLLLLFLLLVTLVVALSYYFYNREPVSIEKTKAIAITAKDLYTAYILDSAAANKKFSGKVLLVTGDIGRVDSNQQGKAVIQLQTGVPGAYINCSMDQQVQGMRTGYPVNIKGYCSGIGEADEELGIKPDVYITRALVAD